MPNELRRQFDPVLEYLETCRVPQVRIEGVEADDAIASLVAQARADGAGDVEVLIAASDKDFYQLVDESTKVISLSGSAAPMDAQHVFEKTGVYPDQFVEWLALIGDTSDNIPGVPGVGPKTAAKLLAEHGGLKQIWDNLNTVRPRRIQGALRESRRAVGRNLELIRLDRNVDCLLDWDAARVRPEDPARVLPLLVRLELKSLAEELREPTLL